MDAVSPTKLPTAGRDRRHQEFATESKIHSIPREEARKVLLFVSMGIIAKQNFI